MTGKWVCRDNGGEIEHLAVVSEATSYKGSPCFLVLHRRYEKSKKEERQFYRIHGPDGRVLDLLKGVMLDHPDDMIQRLEEGEAPSSPMILEKLAWLETVELPESKKARYISEGIPEKDAEALLRCPYLEKLLEVGIPARTAANWILSDSQGADLSSIDPLYMAEMVRMVDSGEISRATAKDKVLPAMLAGEEPKAFVAQNGLGRISDTDAIKKTVEDVLKTERGAKLLADYKGGKKQALNAIFGECMRAMAGKGDPAAIRKILEGL